MNDKTYVWGSVAALAIVAALVAFCFYMVHIIDEGDRADAAWDANPRNPINVCIARGGVPITSAWDGRLKTCEKAP